MGVREDETAGQVLVVLDEELQALKNAYYEATGAEGCLLVQMSVVAFELSWIWAMMLIEIERELRHRRDFGHDLALDSAPYAALNTSKLLLAATSLVDFLGKHVIPLATRLLLQYGSQISDKSSMARMVGTNKAYAMARTPVLRTALGVMPDPSHRVVTDDIGWGLCVLVSIAERLEQLRWKEGAGKTSRVVLEMAGDLGILSDVREFLKYIWILLVSFGAKTAEHQAKRVINQVDEVILRAGCQPRDAGVHTPTTMMRMLIEWHQKIMGKENFAGLASTTISTINSIS